MPIFTLPEFYDSADCPNLDTDKILDLLAKVNNEFIPPLSYRHSSLDTDFVSVSDRDGISDYFNSIRNQHFLTVKVNDEFAGFLSYRTNDLSEIISQVPILKSGHLETDNLGYVSTLAIYPQFRGMGLAGGFYDWIITNFPDLAILTRTWNSNNSHIRILSKRGFDLIYSKEDDRGLGVDTVYYYRAVNK